MVMQIMRERPDNISTFRPAFSEKKRCGRWDGENVDDGKKDVDNYKKKGVDNSFPNILTNEGERDKGHGNVHRSHSQSRRLALGRIWGNLENVSFNSKDDEAQT